MCHKKYIAINNALDFTRTMLSIKNLSLLAMASIEGNFCCATNKAILLLPEYLRVSEASKGKLGQLKVRSSDELIIPIGNYFSLFENLLIGTPVSLTSILPPISPKDFEAISAKNPNKRIELIEGKLVLSEKMYIVAGNTYNNRLIES
jgi:hypothetical protein